MSEIQPPGLTTRRIFAERQFGVIEVVEYACDPHAVECCVLVRKLLGIRDLESDALVDRFKIHLAVVSDDVLRIGVADESAVLAEVAAELK